MSETTTIATQVISYKYRDQDLGTFVNVLSDGYESMSFCLDDMDFRFNEEENILDCVKEFVSQHKILGHIKVWSFNKQEFIGDWYQGNPVVIG